MKKYLIAALLLVFYTVFGSSAAYASAGSFTVSCAAESTGPYSTNRLQLEAPNDGYYSDGDYFTSATISGFLPSGDSVMLVSTFNNTPNASGPYSLNTPIDVISAFPTADPQALGNLYLLINGNTPGGDVYISSASSYLGGQVTGTCASADSAASSSSGGSSTSGGTTSSGGSTGTSSGSSSSSGTSSSCPVCACKDEINAAIAPVQSDLDSINGKLDALQPMKSDLDTMTGQLGDISNTLNGIKSDTGNLVNQFTPTSPATVPASPSFPSADSSKPVFPYSTYTDNTQHFTDQGDNATPGPLPNAPEPSDNWSGIKQQAPGTAQPPLSADKPVLQSPVQSSSPVLSESPVQSTSPVLKQSPVGSSTPVPKQDSPPVQSPVPNRDPVLKQEPVDNRSPDWQSGG